MAFPEKGSHIPLAYTKHARHRVNIGIRWDPVEDIPLVPKENPFAIEPPPPSDIEHTRKLSSEDIREEKSEEEKTEEEELAEIYGYQIDASVGHIAQTFDVDLVCLVFDAQGNFMDAVSPDPTEVIDQSGKIYHTGDEQHGISEGDDEVISVELRDLPPYAHCLVFLATVQSGHDFSQVIKPEARIEDAMSHKDLALIDLGGKNAKGQTAIIICSLYRGAEDWMLHNISEFRVDQNIKDWTQEVRPFLN